MQSQVGVFLILKKSLFCGISIIFLLGNGCSRSEVVSGQTAVFSKGLILTDSLRINLPTNTRDPDYEVGVYWSYDDYSFSFLTELESPVMHLNRFDFRDTSWTRNKLYKQGPNQVFSKGGFNSIQDSLVYFFPVVGNNLVKLNLKGEVIDSYNFSANGFENYNSQNKSPELLYKDGSVYFDITEYYSLKEESTFTKSNLIGKYDLVSGELETLVKFPKEFHNNTWSTNDSDRSSVFVNDRIYMNFNKSSFIYEFDLNGTLLNKAYAGTKKIKDAQKRSDDKEVNAIMQQSNGYYHKLIYDKWRGVFYRIGIYFDSDREIRNTNDMAELAAKRTLGIIILDENLNMLGMSEFSIKTRVSENYYFVNKDGLYLRHYTEGYGEVLDFRKLELIDLETYLNL